MGEVLVLKLSLMYSVFNAMFIFYCSCSMPLSHILTTKLKGNETDRLALLAIKAKIQHEPNRFMSSWNESIHFCLWRGVTCSRRHHQRVTMLDLNSQGLAGSISPHIGNLSFLRVVHLDSNSFTHEIPPEIGRLRRLQVLDLANNSFTGLIPANISNCFNLTYLNFGWNKLVGEIPSKLGFLHKLQTLVLQINNLTGEIPLSFGNLSSLRQLGGTGNNLMGSMSTSLGQLKKLTFLSFGLNMLSGIIPPSFHNLSAIVTFSIPLNQIQGSIPSYLSNNAFPNLKIFNIGGNQLTGSIPLSISNVTSLVRFDVGMNNLTGQVPNLGKLHNLTDFAVDANYLGSGEHGDPISFVSELTNATQLRWLVFGYNNFGGILPPSISNLSTNLEMFWIPYTQLHGSVPIGLANLVKLQTLGMGGNSFTGNIPTDIGKLSRLVELFLYNNELSGRIPSSLGNLTMLTTLELRGNNLNGTIPSSLKECHNLLKLDLSRNNLDGTITQQLITGLLSLSISLNLSKNHFSGSLPPEIGKLKNLGALDFSDNMLSGELPSSLGICESLEVLHLQGNFFMGLIPSSMKKLKGTRDVDLSRNNLSGDIQLFLEGFGNLENLNLSFNDFWGEVPTEGVFKNLSVTSLVGNTRLCGGIANLRLPVCKSKGGGLSHRIKLMISLIFGFALLGNVVVFSFWLLCKKRKETKLKILRNSVLQVSYATLLKATDRFSSTNLIGVSAFGSVYKGFFAEDSVIVAVKVFNMLHQGVSKSFISECEVMRNIRHRNVVKILTACSSIDFNNNVFKAIVYEFMENGSLEEWLHPSVRIEEVIDAPKILSLVQRLDIAIDVACALDYLHNHCERPIVHCDLKPSNVLLDRELIGHVSDFGMAMFLPTLTNNVYRNQSNSIGIKGSIGYVAPEYGMGSEMSTNGDVYSFGILLLELFTGKRPTDTVFSDGLNLHNYVKAAFPNHITKIADSLVLQRGITNDDKVPNKSSVRAQKIEECLTLIFRIGIACSAENPTNRNNINDVVLELHSIRDNFLG